MCTFLHQVSARCGLRRAHGCPRPTARTPWRTSLVVAHAMLHAVARTTLVIIHAKHQIQWVSDSALQPKQLSASRISRHRHTSFAGEAYDLSYCREAMDATSQRRCAPARAALLNAWLPRGCRIMAARSMLHRLQRNAAPILAISQIIWRLCGCSALTRGQSKVPCKWPIIYGLRQWHSPRSMRVINYDGVGC